MADVPPTLVTVTSTLPAACAGAVAVIDVAELTVTLVAATPPKLTVSPAVNPVPVIVTDVPPAVGPLVGLTAVTVGGADIGELVGAARRATCHRRRHRHVNACRRPRPGRRRDRRRRVDRDARGRRRPEVTTVAPVKPVPVIVTDVPPAVGPLVGLTA